MVECDTEYASTSQATRASDFSPELSEQEDTAYVVTSSVNHRAQMNRSTSDVEPQTAEVTERESIGSRILRRLKELSS